MVVSTESLGLKHLQPEEKLELIGLLWEEVVQSVPPGSLLTDAQREELRRRAADSERHPENSVAWEEVYAESLRRLKA
jgi:putative addiction module component (TIGR02574 family)